MRCRGWADPDWRCLQDDVTDCLDFQGPYLYVVSGIPCRAGTFLIALTDIVLGFSYILRAIPSALFDFPGGIISLDAHKEINAYGSWTLLPTREWAHYSMLSQRDPPGSSQIGQRGMRLHGGAIQSSTTAQ